MINQAIAQITRPKFRQRAISILTNSLNNLLLPVFNPVIAWMVIRFASVELWGAFVNLMILVQFGAHVIAWGNREYLLREFSRTPAKIGEIWRTSLQPRFLLFVGFSTLLLFWRFPTLQWGLAVIWALSLAWEQSYDVFILYKKDFRFELGMELLGTAVLAGGVYAQLPALRVEHLILWFTSANLVKIAGYTIRYRDYVRGGRNEEDKRFAVPWQFLVQALPFFLLGFSGMLQSRVDLYSVSYFLPAREVGQYQVFSNLMIYLQSLANFILIPFVKNLYRLPEETIRKISLRLFLFGLGVIVPALGVVYFVLTRFYEMEFPFSFYLFGGLFVLPIYFYLPTIYALYKTNQQNKVLGVNLAGSVLTLILNFLLLPRLGMIGAVISVALVRWLVWFTYAIISRRSVNIPT